MEIIKHRIPGGPYEQVVIAPIGDFQWSGPQGPTALGHLKAHIERAQDWRAWFVGMGDYIDFLSPSNRMRLRAAALYDTAEEVIDEAALRLAREIFDLALKPTKGQWIGLIEGHHFSELADGTTTDVALAEMLGAPFLGTSAIVKVEFLAPGTRKKPRLVHAVFYLHHGTGGGTLPSAPLNKLYHVSAGYEGVDAYIMGHTTKSPATRLSKPFPVWERNDLEHRDILLINAGGFSKSGVVGRQHGPIPRGDYAEQRMLTPSPLSAPFVFLYPRPGSDRAELKVML